MTKILEVAKEIGTLIEGLADQEISLEEHRTLINQKHVDLTPLAGWEGKNVDAHFLIAN